MRRAGAAGAGRTSSGRGAGLRAAGGRSRPPSPCVVVGMPPALALGLPSSLSSQPLCHGHSTVPHTGQGVTTEKMMEEQGELAPPPGPLAPKGPLQPSHPPPAFDLGLCSDEPTELRTSMNLSRHASKSLRKSGSHYTTAPSTFMAIDTITQDRSGVTFMGRKIVIIIVKKFSFSPLRQN